MHLIGTIRFNTDTLKQNIDWTKQNDFNGCIYGCPLSIKSEIKTDSNLYILEMNNDINEIIGIGLIKNKSIKRNIKYKIYDVDSYNSFIYRGKYKVVRDDFNQEEMIFIKKMENLIFKGSKHLKRGRGITILPNRIMYDDKLKCQEEIRRMFSSRFDSSQNQ